MDVRPEMNANDDRIPVRLPTGDRSAHGVLRARDRSVAPRVLAALTGLCRACRRLVLRRRAGRRSAAVDGSPSRWIGALVSGTVDSGDPVIGSFAVPFPPMERDARPHYSGLYAEDHPPAGLCIATLTVLDSSGFEREFDPVLVDERVVTTLVREGESL